MGSNCFSCGNGKNRVIVVKDLKQESSKPTASISNKNSKGSIYNNIVDTKEVRKQSVNNKKEIVQGPVIVESKKTEDPQLKKSDSPVDQEKRTTNFMSVDGHEPVKRLESKPKQNSIKDKAINNFFDVDKYYNMIIQIDTKKKEEKAQIKRTNSNENVGIDVTKYLNMIDKIDKCKKVPLNN
jgi:phage anti-repressor protein